MTGCPKGCDENILNPPTISKVTEIGPIGAFSQNNPEYLNLDSRDNDGARDNDNDSMKYSSDDYSDDDENLDGDDDDNANCENKISNYGELSL